ncbi:unnamed protein product [Rotaria sp. Silwood2]|nr:unnamed protein product [Rotaria sp. Silwood2]CAF2868461.1 unnamed protein product [Rotaria sp. Silwood2]CAF3242645.1 unnamed protein product [Rotaria sp. Silwood2]CAF4091573.1 unnamed protein product [Rotaria sp. Silwood2]CAF4114186.1 unnamed protein product [Rotaria sp. Silwood2]
MENDNLLYGDLYHLATRMHACNVSIAIARASVNQAVTSFVFIRNSKAIEHFAKWIVNVFAMGREKAIQYLNTRMINDMTLGARYLRLFAAFPEQSIRTGVFELPTWFYSDNESCCLCHGPSRTPIIFDACVLGQYFGGTYAAPNTPHWEKNRLIDPRGLALEWRSSPLKNLKLPYIKGIQIINLHIHSKRLQKFSSAGNNQSKGF